MPQIEFIDFKQWREENAPKLQQSQKKFQEAHPQYQKKWRQRNPEKVKTYNATQTKHKYWVGIDGEGKTCSRCGAHHYISLNWSDAQGRHRGEIVAEPWPSGMCCQEAEAKGIKVRLKTEDCLQLILSIPKQARIVGYALGYDLTKWVEDMPDAAIFRLPRLPAGRKKARVRWITPSGKRYKLGLLSTELYVTECNENWKDIKTRTVHDGFKFFGRTFVGALDDWDVGSKEERKYLQEMKDKRGNFEKEDTRAIVDYSDLEVRRLAELMAKMVNAHPEDIKLTMFYGAGSTAAAMLHAMKIPDFMPEEKYDQAYPELFEAIAMAFFGGRFEIARQGFVRQQVYDWDISSAYPYHIYQLPCLRCGKWSKTRDIDRVKAANAALVRYELGRWKHGLPAWGPFPFREKEGTIPFPIESGGGWLCKDEFFAGQRIWDNVLFREAWVYETSCTHHPFKNVPHWYLARLGIGKEGAGIVFKLGLNAIYGKLAQQIGSRKYHNLLWAAIITSGCRAQLLDLMGCHERLQDIIMVATDGLNGLVEVTPPKPRDTGTDINVWDRKDKKQVRKPLGAWEKNIFEQGMFLARPGIYFPITDKPEGHKRHCDCEVCTKGEKMFKEAKARGIGTRHLWNHRFDIMRHWEEHYGEPYTFFDDPRDKNRRQALDRFVGLRTGITIGGRRTDLYGRWYRKVQKLDFKPEPKRNFDSQGNLAIRRIDRTLTSAPYSKRDEVAEDMPGHNDDFLFDSSFLESLDQPDWDG